MTLLVASNEGDDTHVEVPGHPEARRRSRAALDGLARAGLSETVVAVPPRVATIDELARVHDRGYLDWLRDLCADGGGRIDADTYAAPGSWDTARRSAGAGLAVVDALRRGGDAGFVITRPPGHHARRAQAMGFCLLNNIAVTAAALADAGERVLIVDWDVHHGNGTQELFYDDPRVLFACFHQEPLYPGTGSAADVGGPSALGSTIEVPLPAGATGDVLLHALESVVAPEVERFGPTWVLVSAGFDGHRSDPLAGWRLTAGDYGDLASAARAFAPAAGRTIAFLEGGYDLDALRASVGAAAAALVGVEARSEPRSTGGPGMEAVERARSVRERALGA